MASASIYCPANDRITLPCVPTPSFYPFCCLSVVPGQMCVQLYLLHSTVHTSRCVSRSCVIGAHSGSLLVFWGNSALIFTVVILICIPTPVNKSLFPYTHILTSTVIFCALITDLLIGENLNLSVPLASISMMGKHTEHLSHIFLCLVYLFLLEIKLISYNIFWSLFPLPYLFPTSLPFQLHVFFLSQKNKQENKKEDKNRTKEINKQKKRN